MVKEYRDKIQKIFSDVAPEHRFWLVKGGELKNLEELEKALEMMDDATFSHHVNAEKNDFAGWIRNSVDDDELADTLDKIKTKETTLKAISLRISSLKNFQSIHEAIDNVKEKIHVKQKELDETLNEPPLPTDIHVNSLRKGLTSVSFYVGMLAGFALGAVLGYMI